MGQELLYGDAEMLLTDRVFSWIENCILQKYDKKATEPVIWNHINEYVIPSLIWSAHAVDYCV
jgi:hypothetical protein